MNPDDILATPSIRRRAVFVGIAMALTAGATVMARPDTLLASSRQVDLESLIPGVFGEWSIDRSIVPIQPSPDVIDKIDAIYDETLARTYIDRNGQRIMLSIAYGGDQTGRLRVHRPESCYSAQGFAVKKIRDEVQRYGSSSVPLKRLSAKLGARAEPITYWIRVGGETVTGNIGQRIAQLRYGLVGEIPDGLIFRVSSIDVDVESAFKLHDDFIRSLFQKLNADSLKMLIGDPGGPTV